jgi:tetratricopeptide (TPR) repeat protein
MSKARRNSPGNTKQPTAAQGREAETAGSNWRRNAVSMLLLWTAALIAYSNSFENGLIFDSNSAIVQDSRVWSATSENLKSLATEDYWYAEKTNGLYRPLTKISYLFNYAVLGSGPHPASYHWVNFALHAVNILLVYLLGLLLLREFRLAIALAAVWGLHPVLTESVANVVGRADLLAAFGLLAGLLCHARATAASGWRKGAWLAALAMSAAIGIFSKESAAVLPVAMLIYDVAHKPAATWRARLGGYCAVAPPFLAYFYLRSLMIAALYETEAGRFAFVQNPLVGTDFWTSRLTAVKVIGKYVGLWLWPARLSCDYSYNQVPLFDWRLSNGETWWALVALAGCAAAVVGAIIWYRSRPALFFFIAFFFAAIAPTSNMGLLIGTIMAERFLYLPSVALAGVFVLAVFRASDHRAARSHLAAWAPWAVIGVVCALFAVRTYVRNFDWRDEASLWASAVEAAPGSYMTHLGVAVSAMAGGTAAPETIDREISRCLAIVNPLPDDESIPLPFATAGSWYRTRGDMAAGGPAGLWYQQALTELLRARRIDLALRDELRRRNLLHGKTLPCGNPSPGLYLDLGRVYLRLSQPMQAIEALEYGRLLSPQPDFSEELGHAYRAAGDDRQAAVALHEGILLTPGYRRFAPELVDLYRKIDAGGCALATYRNQPALNFQCPLVADTSCKAARNVVGIYDKLGRRDDADRLSRAATRDWSCPAGMFP